MSSFSHILLLWYSRHGRQLPWRGERDPYRIWVSEIILQQTRVSQGYDYFLRFMQRFPHVQALAEASEDEVMRLWQGLGYYARARHLHAAAKRMNGRFPTTYEEVRALPGVGPYTAAAVCSLAYGMPHAVVDGNVYRVLARFFGIEEPIDTAGGRKLFHALAQECLDPSRAADYNQAIMDFGALQCVPGRPLCARCPLAGECAALRQGRVEQLPVKTQRVQKTHRYFHYFYVRAGHCTFIRKRTGRDIWQNLYELPLIEAPAPMELDELLRHPGFREWLEPGEEVELLPMDGTVSQTLTHRVVHARIVGLRLPADTRSFSRFQKVEVERVDSYAFPRLLTTFFDRMQPEE